MAASAVDYRALSTEELVSLGRGIEQRGRPHDDPNWGAVVALHDVSEVREALARALGDPDDGVRESAREGLDALHST